MRFGRSLLACIVIIPLAGCHSKYVEATITNKSGEALNVVQVDYPSASFGTQLLKPGETFHYRFKLLGSGPIKLSYTDAKQQDHHQDGPTLLEGQEGRLQIVFPSQDHADFQASMHP